MISILFHHYSLASLHDLPLTPELSGAPLLRVRLERQVSEVIGLSAARRMEETGGGCFDLAIIPRLLKKTCDFSIA